MKYAVYHGVTPMDGIVAVRMYGCYSLRSGSPELHPWGGVAITVSLHRQAVPALRRTVPRRGDDLIVLPQGGGHR